MDIKETKNFWKSVGLPEEEIDKMIEDILEKKRQIMTLFEEHPQKKEDCSMEIIFKTIATGQHLDKKATLLIGKEGNAEIQINIENGNGLVSELSRNGYGYDYHRPVSVKEMSVVITGGDLRDGEYMVRRMTPEQIYETLRDGFTITASGFQS